MLTHVVAVVGPTASGKSDYGIHLARTFGGEVVSADSRQVYRGMDLGTGKVEGTRDENRARTVTALGRPYRLVPLSSEGVDHWLLDVADPRAFFTMAEYQVLARDVLEDIARRGRLPLLVGGTGLYVRAVLEGLQVPAAAPDPVLRALPFEEHLRRLRELDPHAAIDWMNPRRVIRALEIVQHTGRPLGESRRLERPDFRSLVLGVQIDPETLRRRIHQRLASRLDAGMIEEVQRLLAEGVPPERLEAFGLEYRFVGRHLAGLLPRHDMQELLERAIVQYARRQLTWFRKYGSVQWVSSLEEAVHLLASFLLL